MVCGDQQGENFQTGKDRRLDWSRGQWVSHSRGEDFRWKVGDVGGDGPACQELSHLVGERVAVVLKQTIPVTSKPWRKERQ